MSLPSPLLSTPALTADQLFFNGVTLGAGNTGFNLKKLEGLDKADVRSGNTDRPRARGSFPGLNLLKSRLITVTFDAGPFGLLSQTNLVPDPSFEYDAVGLAPATSLWSSAVDAQFTLNTFLVSGSWAASGVQSLHVQGTHDSSTTSAQIQAHTHVGASGFPVLVGGTYVAQAQVNVIGAASQGLRAQIRWYASDGTQLSTSSGALTGAGATGLLSLSVTAVAPASAVFAAVFVIASSNTANQVVEFYLDAVIATTGSSIVPYFDGDTPGAAWAGTPGQSASQNPAPQPYSSLASGLAALRTACSTEGATEFPLWIQMPGFPLVATMARVLKANIPWDIVADLGGMAQNCTLQFEATDPYFYAAPTQDPAIGLPTPGLGFHFPIRFPLSFGGGSTANQQSVTNLGDVPCWPVLVITGPCLNPMVQNQSIAGAPTLSFGIQLNAGDQLVVDCDMGSIVFYPAGSTVGSPYPQVLQPASTFFSLPSGTSVVSFNSQDLSQASGTLSIWSSSAYSSLL